MVDSIKFQKITTYKEIDMQFILFDIRFKVIYNYQYTESSNAAFHLDLAVR